MVRIGGNVTGYLQTRTGTKNDIGETVNTWTTAHTLKGFLDLSSGESRYTTFNAKIQESTHIFVCDFVQLAQNVTSENSRMTVNGNVYDVTLIDNPMGLNEHLEIYLRYTGGQG